MQSSTERPATTKRSTPLPLLSTSEQDFAVPNLEAAILGGAMLDPTIAGIVAGLEQEDFYSPFHRAVHGTIKRLVEQGAAVDTRTVLAVSPKEVAAHGGAVALARLEIEGTGCYAGSAPWYAEAIRRSRRKRDFYREVIATLPAVRDSEVEELEARILAVFARIDQGLLAPPLADLLSRRAEELREQRETGNVRQGIPSPWPSLDRLGMILAPGEVTVLAGRTSHGKTAVALNWALHASWTRPVFFVSLEMSEEALTNRALAILSNVRAERIRTGAYLSASDVDAATESAQAYNGQLRVIEGTSLSVSAVAAQLRAVRADENALVVVDYLQLLRPTNPKAPRQEQVAQLSRECKTVLAGGLGCAVLLLAQLHRPEKGRQNPEPGLHELRESGAVENDADAVILLHRPNFGPSEPSITRLEAIVAKQRNGPTGRAHLLFFRETQVVTEAAT